VTYSSPGNPALASAPSSAKKDDKKKGKDKGKKREFKISAPSNFQVCLLTAMM
jgi:hypothetical protein